MGDKNSKECYNCLNPINLTIDKYVLLQTCENGKSIESNYYHFECWNHYFKKAVAKKLGALQNSSLKIVREMFKKGLGGDSGIGKQQFPEL